MGCITSKKKLSKPDLEFLEENTEFTKEQIIEWYEGFIVSKSQNKICKKKEKKSFPSTKYTSNNHMVHRHCEIAFPVRDYVSNWLMFIPSQDFHLSTHAFLPIVRLVSLMIGHAKRSTKFTPLFSSDFVS
jgi:hypothetical protein